MRAVLILCSLLFLCSACGKWIVGKNPANTPAANYESFYQTVKANYAFFEEKGINWDSLDQVYRPLILPKMGNDSLYLVLSEMLNHLGDGHVNLWTSYDRSRNWDWYLDYPANFNQTFLHRNYWGKDYLQTGPLINTWLSDSIGYIYYGSFSSAFSKAQLNYVLNRFADSKGLIIDVRENGGGALSRVYRLMERFVPEKTFMGTLRYKTGPGPDDFSERDSFFVKPIIDFKARAEAKAKKEAKEARRKKRRGEPEEKDKDQEEETTATADTLKRRAPDTTAMYLHKPIVVLTNRHSYSATNFFAGFMSILPNVTLIGDQTGGGGGVPVSYELPNGWKYRFSATQTFLPDGTSTESGIQPDIFQTTGPEEEIEGIDAIIERGKAHILEQVKRE